MSTTWYGVPGGHCRSLGYYSFLPTVHQCKHCECQLIHSCHHRPSNLHCSSPLPITIISAVSHQRSINAHTMNVNLGNGTHHRQQDQEPHVSPTLFCTQQAFCTMPVLNQLSYKSLMVSRWMLCTPVWVCAPSQASQFRLASLIISSAAVTSFNELKVFWLTFTHTPHGQPTDAVHSPESVHTIQSFPIWASCVFDVNWKKGFLQKAEDLLVTLTSVASH